MVEKEKKAESNVGINKDYLNDRFSINTEKSIKDLSSDFAKAYNLSDEDDKYALIFEKFFPVRLKVIEELKKKNVPFIQQIVDYGKIFIESKKTESFAVILTKPKGKPLSEVVEGGKKFDEQAIEKYFIGPIASVIDNLTLSGIVHGSINPGNIYYDKDSEEITVKECISEFCGLLQDPAYDTLDRLLCHPAAKGDGDYGSDYFSLGMLVLFLISGKKPFDKFDREVITNIRLTEGSYESSLENVFGENGAIVSKHIDNLLIGLLTDDLENRWHGSEIQDWIKKFDNPAQKSKLHKQTKNSFTFDDRTYVSKKHLAHDLFLKWDTTKKSLEISELARWIEITLKDQDLANNIKSFERASSGIALIQDDRISRIITLLDPEGPIRYQNFSGNIFGIGAFIAAVYITDERDYLRQIAGIFKEELTDYWIRNQEDPEEYSYMAIPWSSIKIKDYVRNQEMGFGMERCLYELNPTISCQSNLLKKYHIENLKELIVALNEIVQEQEDVDIFDRHIAAYIATHVKLISPLRLKSLQSFPQISKNSSVVMLSFLAAAAKNTNAAKLHSLTTYFCNKLTVLKDILHSKAIRQNFENQLKSAADKGDINALITMIDSPVFIKRDLTGFQEARKQYHGLSRKIVGLKKHSNIQKLAYKIGLRISVTIAYLLCAITAIYVMFQTV